MYNIQMYMYMYIHCIQQCTHTCTLYMYMYCVLQSMCSDVCVHVHCTCTCVCSTCVQPSVHQGAVVPDPTADYYLYDRVVNVQPNTVVPFGLRGTVIGIRGGIYSCTNTCSTNCTSSTSSTSCTSITNCTSTLYIVVL